MNEVFKALSDPTRRKILDLLKKDELNAGEIASNFDISKPSISHHLSILKNAKLVDSRRVGQEIFYFINTTVLQEVVTWFYDIRGVEDDEEN